MEDMCYERRRAEVWTRAGCWVCTSPSGYVTSFGEACVPTLGLEGGVGCNHQVTFDGKFDSPLPEDHRAHILSTADSSRHHCKLGGGLRLDQVGLSYHWRQGSTPHALCVHFLTGKLNWSTNLEEPHFLRVCGVRTLRSADLRPAWESVGAIHCREARRGDPKCRMIGSRSCYAAQFRHSRTSDRAQSRSCGRWKRRTDSQRT